MSRVDQQRRRYLENLQTQIEEQLEKNGQAMIMDLNPQTGKQEEITYDERQAKKRINRLQLEIDVLDGVPWSERHHKGLAAVAAAVVRVVVDLASRIKPEYRDMLKNVYDEEFKRWKKEKETGEMDRDEIGGSDSRRESGRDEYTQSRDPYMQAQPGPQPQPTPQPQPQTYSREEPVQEQAPAPVTKKPADVEKEAFEKEQASLEKKVSRTANLERNAKVEMGMNPALDTVAKGVQLIVEKEPNFIRDVKGELLTDEVVRVAVMGYAVKNQAEHPDTFKPRYAVKDVLTRNPAAVEHLSLVYPEISQKEVHSAIFNADTIMKAPQILQYQFPEREKFLDEVKPGNKTFEHLIENLQKDLVNESRSSANARDFIRNELIMDQNPETAIFRSNVAGHLDPAALSYPSAVELYEDVGKLEANGMDRQQALSQIAIMIPGSVQLMEEQDKSLLPEQLRDLSIDRDALQKEAGVPLQPFPQPVMQPVPEMQVQDALSEYDFEAAYETVEEEIPQQDAYDLDDPEADMPMIEIEEENPLMEMEYEEMEPVQQAVVPMEERLRDVLQANGLRDTVQDAAVQYYSSQENSHEIAAGFESMTRSEGTIDKDRVLTDLIDAGVPFEVHDLSQEDWTPAITAEILYARPEAFGENLENIPRAALNNETIEVIAGSGHAEEIIGNLQNPGLEQKLANDIRTKADEMGCPLPPREFSKSEKVQDTVDRLSSYMKTDKFQYMTNELMVAETVKNEILDIEDIPEDERTATVLAAAVIANPKNAELIPDHIPMDDVITGFAEIEGLTDTGEYEAPDLSYIMDNLYAAGTPKAIELANTFGEYAYEATEEQSVMDPAPARSQETYSIDEQGYGYEM